LGKDLCRKEFSILLISVEYILNEAIKKGGSSIKNYKNIDEELGYFQIEFKVYNKEGMACYQCDNLIAKRKQNGRSTFFCKICQPIN
ncbi:DNA-formamidopyrimidine glycosylase, partial [Alphaproteobacteria bacterium]|nr:DNA-formamidopyrimidine glycosylase [Alphaproteobacteria bacterium]